MVGRLIIALACTMVQNAALQVGGLCFYLFSTFFSLFLLFSFLFFLLIFPPFLSFYEELLNWVSHRAFPRIALTEMSVCVIHPLVIRDLASDSSSMTQPDTRAAHEARSEKKQHTHTHTRRSLVEADTFFSRPRATPMRQAVTSQHRKRCGSKTFFV